MSKRFGDLGALDDVGGDMDSFDGGDPDSDKEDENAFLDDLENFLDDDEGDDGMDGGKFKMFMHRCAQQHSHEKERRKKIRNCREKVKLTINDRINDLGDNEVEDEFELFRHLVSEDREKIKRKRNRKAIEMLHECLDIEIVFMVDCTGSMDHSIKQVMLNVTKIVEFYERAFDKMKLGVAFLGYRDKKDYPNLVYHDFQTPEEIAEKLKEEDAFGGWDVPEDIHQALYHVAHEIKWEKRTRILIHVCDSVCHGKKFQDPNHEFRDDFPNGMCYDPNVTYKNGVSLKQWREEEGGRPYPYEQTIEQLLKTIKNKEIWYHFLEVPDKNDNLTTRTMTKIFKKWYEEEGSNDLEFWIHGYEEDYLNNIRMCIHRSLTCEIERTMSKFQGVYNTNPFYKFRVVRDNDPSGERRVMLDSQECKCYVLQNEKEMCAYNVEHFQPRFRRQMRDVQIESAPFAEGGIRYAFKVRDLKKGKMYVGKCFKAKKKDVMKLLREDVRIQVCAKRLAEEFNREIKKTGVEERINFIGMDVIIVVKMKVEQEKDGEIAEHQICMTLEEYIEKDESDPDGFVKFNNQLNAITQNTLYDDTQHEICQAFSHYTTFVTGGYLIVVDLQGFYRAHQKLYVLTDPAVHSFVGIDDSDKFEVPTNFGTEGMKEFMKLHKCNHICEKLGLNEWNHEEWILQKEEKIKEQREKLLSIDDDDEEEEDEDEDEKRGEMEPKEYDPLNDSELDRHHHHHHHEVLFKKETEEPDIEKIEDEDEGEEEEEEEEEIVHSPATKKKVKDEIMKRIEEKKRQTLKEADEITKELEKMKLNEIQEEERKKMKAEDDERIAKLQKELLEAQKELEKMKMEKEIEMTEINPVLIPEGDVEDDCGVATPTSPTPPKPKKSCFQKFCCLF